MHDTLAYKELTQKNFAYEALALFGVLFQKTSAHSFSLYLGPKHHISLTLQQRIRFALCCFRSTLLTASQLVSFPAGTKMLQFPAFPLTMH